jgi:amylosucrase
MIAVRKSIEAMADFNNRELIDVGNPHLFVFTRTHPSIARDSVLVVANFNDRPEQFNLRDLRNRGRFELGELRDLVSGASPTVFNGQLVIPAYGYYWLVGA